jgi:hypothetical protein
VVRFLGRGDGLCGTYALPEEITKYLAVPEVLRVYLAAEDAAWERAEGGQRDSWPPERGRRVR